MSIDYKITLEGIGALSAKFNAAPLAIEKAMVSSCNKLARSGLTQGKRAITAKYNVTLSAIKDSVYTIPAKRAGMAGARFFAMIVAAAKKGIPLYRFGALPKRPPRQRGIPIPRRKAVTVQVLKEQGRKIVPHAFVAMMPSGHIGVFHRKAGNVPAKTGHAAIMELYSLSVPIMFKNASIKAIEQLVMSKGRQVFEKELAFYTGEVFKQ
jgi:hypothetical protein